MASAALLETGYYIGLCTDATLKSPSCSSRCSDDHGQQDIAYNSDDDLWACCGSKKACANPTNETFLAPPPEQLLAAASSLSASSAAASSSQPRSTADSTSISRATVAMTSTPSTAVDQTTSSLDGAAKAGIGVGAAVAAVVMVALLVWVILLTKKLRRNGPARDSTVRPIGGLINEGLPEAAHEIAVREQELNGGGLSHEMAGR